MRYTYKSAVSHLRSAALRSKAKLSSKQGSYFQTHLSELEALLDEYEEIAEFSGAPRRDEKGEIAESPALREVGVRLREELKKLTVFVVENIGVDRQLRSDAWECGVTIAVPSNRKENAIAKSRSSSLPIVEDKIPLISKTHRFNAAAYAEASSLANLLGTTVTALLNEALREKVNEALRDDDIRAEIERRRAFLERRKVSPANRA